MTQSGDRPEAYRAEALRHDTFETELAGMLEDDCAVVLVEVFAQLQAVAYPTDQLREGSLAELDRLASQIAAIELQDARASAKIVPTFTNEINGLS